MKVKKYLWSVAVPLLLLAGKLSAQGITTERPAGTTEGPVGTTDTKVSQQNLTESLVKEPAALGLEFAVGSSQLSVDQKEKIRLTMSGVGAKDEVRIAAWADKAWSAESKENKFNKADKELAEQRGKAIKDYIASNFPKTKVEVVTMTEEPGFFARVFNTDEAEVKSIFAKKGDQGTHERNLDTIAVRDKGGPSKAVMIINRK